MKKFLFLGILVLSTAQAQAQAQAQIESMVNSPGLNNNGAEFSTARCRFYDSGMHIVYISTVDLVAYEAPIIWEDERLSIGLFSTVNNWVSIFFMGKSDRLDDFDSTPMQNLDKDGGVLRFMNYPGYKGNIALIHCYRFQRTINDSSKLETKEGEKNESNQNPETSGMEPYEIQDDTSRVSDSDVAKASNQVGPYAETDQQ